MFKLIAIDIISLLVNLSCELGQQMTRYRFIGARRVILGNVQIIPNYLILVLVNLCELEQLMIIL